MLVCTGHRLRMFAATYREIWKPDRNAIVVITMLGCQYGSDILHYEGGVDMASRSSMGSGDFKRVRTDIVTLRHVTA